MESNNGDRAQTESVNVSTPPFNEIASLQQFLYPQSVQERSGEEIGVTAAVPIESEVPNVGFVFSSTSDDIPPPKADFSAPPPYELATKLPTYEEVQQEKRLEAQNITVPPAARVR